MELLPSSKTLSVGKAIIRSGPAIAIGGLFLSAHPSHDLSFLQEIENKLAVNKQVTSKFIIDRISVVI